MSVQLNAERKLADTAPSATSSQTQATVVTEGIAQAPDRLETIEGSCSCFTAIQTLCAELIASILACFRVIGETLGCLTPAAAQPRYSPEEIQRLAAFVTKWVN